MTHNTHCALTGVRLDDGHPLHRRRFRGGRFVCLAVANLLDEDPYPDTLARFLGTMAQREAHEREVYASCRR